MVNFVERVVQAQRSIEPTGPATQGEDATQRANDVSAALTNTLVEAFAEALRRIVAANSALQTRIDGFEHHVTEVKGLMRQLDVHVRDVKDHSIDPVRLRELLFAKINELLPPQ